MAKAELYKAVLPDGREYFKEVQVDNRFNTYDIKSVAEDAVQHFKLTTSRKNPVTVPVAVFSQYVKNGEVGYRLSSKYDITPQLERMTSKEFDEEMTEALSELPREFIEYVTSEANNRANSMEEVVSTAEEIVSNLLPAIIAYRKTVIGNKRLPKQ